MAPQHGLDPRTKHLRLTFGLDGQRKVIERLRFEGLDDPECKHKEQRGERRKKIEADAGRQSDGQRGQHDHRIFRVADFRAISNQAGRADDAERARQTGAHHQHDDRPDHRKNDLRLDYRGTSRWCAATSRPKCQGRP